MSLIHNPGDVLSRIPAPNKYKDEDPSAEPLEVEEQVVHGWFERPQEGRAVTLDVRR
jgi:hypothetical protein